MVKRNGTAPRRDPSSSSGMVHPALPIFARRHPGLAAEQISEIVLTRSAHQSGKFLNRLVAISQQPLGLSDPIAIQILDRGHSNLPAEHTSEMMDAQTGYATEDLQS